MHRPLVAFQNPREERRHRRAVPAVPAIERVKLQLIRFSRHKIGLAQTRFRHVGPIRPYQIILRADFPYPGERRGSSPERRVGQLRAMPHSLSTIDLASWKQIRLASLLPCEKPRSAGRCRIFSRKTQHNDSRIRRLIFGVRPDCAPRARRFRNRSRERDTRAHGKFPCGRSRRRGGEFWMSCESENRSEVQTLND